MKKLFFLYILTNHSNNIFYIGVTSNLEHRIFQHQQRFGSMFTKKYKTNKLVYYEQAQDMYYIHHRERLMKKWHKDWKLNLIKASNPDFRDLSEDWI